MSSIRTQPDEGAAGSAAIDELLDDEQDAGSRKRPFWQSNIGLKLLSIGLGLLLWQVMALWQGEFLVSSPARVAVEIWELVSTGEAFPHMLFSLSRVVGGLLISLVIATIVGVAMGLFKPAENFFEAYVLLGMTVPGLAWALIAIMVIGISNWTPVFAITAVAAPLLTLNIWQGTKGIDNDLISMGRAFRADRRLMLRHVIVPQLIPFVLAGTRLGLSVAWKIVVLSEMFGLSNGVGYQIQLAFTSFSITSVIAWTLIFTTVMGAIEFGLLRRIELRVTRWRPNIQEVGR